MRKKGRRCNSVPGSTDQSAASDAWATSSRRRSFCSPCVRATPAFAGDVTAKDIQVIGRALGFMEDAAPGTVDLGIVYAPDIPDSVRQAAAMQSLLGTGVPAGKIVLRPHLVTVDQLGKIDNVGALFIVPAAGQIAAAVIAAAGRLHIPTISTDIACAEAGSCVLAFHSEPTVEVFMNRTAAAGAGVRFTAGFRMLVKQL
jgi:hypothetical protein